MVISTLVVAVLAAIALAEPSRPYGSKIHSHASKYQPPSYTPEPVFRKHVYPEPHYKEPVYSPPDYEESPYRTVYKAHPQPHYKETAHPPVYHPSAYEEPSYPEPHYKKPAYSEPIYKKPSYIPEVSYQPIKAASYGSGYKKEYYCDSKKTPKCAANSTLGYCLEDYEYPEQEVKHAIEHDPLARKKYADVADQSADHLVDGLTAVDEEAFDYSGYHGTPFEKGNWVGAEGYICPSEVLYARPVRAVNVKGEWRVIVQNVAYYTQTQRVETCLFPGASCRTLAPCYHSQCLQKYIYHRMLSFDPCDPYKGLFIDIYKLPSACSCHVS